MNPPTTSRTVAILQARMGATRYPGKMLAALNGEAVLTCAVRRAQTSRTVDELVIATTDREADDVLVRHAERLGVPCCRGSEHDVLARYVAAARRHKAALVVRLTGDNVVVDGSFVDWVVDAFRPGEDDYVGAVPGPDYGLPAGLAAEVFTREALERAHAEDSDPAWREHVTPFLRRRPDLFRARYLVSATDYSALRLALDTPEDGAVLERLFAALGDRPFTWREAAELAAAHPEWRDLNRHVRQKDVP